MSINEQLKSIIAENGIKLTFLSKSTGITYDALNSLVNGKRKITAEEFLKICYALSIDPKIFNDPKTSA